MGGEGKGAEKGCRWKARKGRGALGVWQQPDPSGAGTRRGNSPHGTNRTGRHFPPLKGFSRCLAHFSTREGHFATFWILSRGRWGCCDVETTISLSRLRFYHDVHDVQHLHAYNETMNSCCRSSTLLMLENLILFLSSAPPRQALRLHPSLPGDHDSG